MNIPEIAKCPNPECAVTAKLRVFRQSSEVADSDRFRVVHDYCGYSGPFADTEAEAIRLHNLLCRQPTPEAALPIAWVVLHYGSVTPGGMFYKREEAAQRALENDKYIRKGEPLHTLAPMFLGNDAAHPPKPEPTEAVAEIDLTDGPVMFRCLYTQRPIIELVDREVGLVNHADVYRLSTESRESVPTAPKPPAEWMAATRTILEAWTLYKNYYEHCGAGSLEAGRAWDLMNRAAKRLEEAKHYSAPAGDKT